MTRSPFDPALGELPDEIPVFPLPGVLLLPGGELPLNIFEPRYLAMTRHALSGARIIGMVQPSGEAAGGTPPLYATGCAGRITAFSETPDGRYLITLTGLIRFDSVEELPLMEGFRRVRAEFGRFAHDLERDLGEIDRARLLVAIREYFRVQQIEGDWSAIEAAPNDRLVTSLAMICPFEPSEKQALLEAPTLKERSETMIAMMEMGGVGEAGGAPLH